MDPKFIVDAPESKFIDDARAPGPPLVPKGRKKRIDLDEDPDSILVPDFVEDFFEDDAIEEDFQKYPWNWFIALVAVVPAILHQILEANNIPSDLPIVSNLQPVLKSLASIVVISGPVLALSFSLRGHIGPTLICSMGTSAAVLIQGDSGPLFLQSEIHPIVNSGGAPMVISLILILPLILVLKNKKKLLDPGNSRHLWCSLMAMSILMFAYGTFYAGAEQLHIGEGVAGECAGSFFESLCNNNKISRVLGDGGSLGGIGMTGIATAIVWAWPKGTHIVEEFTTDILQSANADG